MTQKTKPLAELHFSCINYVFEQHLWNYIEFKRLADLRPYINSIKKDLIGKKLDKILFLNCLNNDTYIFKDGLWHRYNETTKQIYGTYWIFCYAIADPPIVLQFEGNNLEIDVSENAGRSFDNNDYIRMSYNKIYDIETIEACFKGINHSVRYKEIIGQKLTQIVTKKKCNKIGFVFENGYSLCIHTDTCADYGTECHLISTSELNKWIR